MARKKKRTGCAARVITIKKKGSKRIIAQFKGHSGPGCGPRRKPTPPPKRFRDEFARQARACKGRKRGAFITCMKRLEF